MSDPNNMTKYDPATVAASAKVADALALEEMGMARVCDMSSSRAELDQSAHHRKLALIAEVIAERIRALPVAPPAPLQVTADDVAACKEAIGKTYGFALDPAILPFIAGFFNARRGAPKVAA